MWFLTLWRPSDSHMREESTFIFSKSLLLSNVWNFWIRPLKERTTLPFPDLTIWDADAVEAEGAAVLDSEMETSS